MVVPVASNVLEALRRAESLFAAAPQPGAGAAAALAAAADTTGAIGADAPGMAGAAAGAHQVFVAGAAQRLHATADADTRLADQLGELADAHAAAAQGARQLRENAEAVVRQYISAPASDAEAGAGALRALRVLRAQVAAMQRLITDQSAAAAAAAQQVRALEYGER